MTTEQQAKVIADAAAATGLPYDMRRLSGPSSPAWETSHAYEAGGLPDRDCRRCGMSFEHPCHWQPAATVPPLAELVTDEDFAASREAGLDAVEAAGDGADEGTYLRAALEAYGARLVARLGRTP